MLTGIQGFDDITEGGLPRGRTTLIMGGPGCGKTVFALQTLVNGARIEKEASVFVAFEESTVQIVANATTFGWDLPALAKKKLSFLDAHLTPEVVKAGDFDLTGLLNLLEAGTRLRGVQTEMEARSEEIKLLDSATGSASKRLTTDRAVLRRMRHADEDVRAVIRTGAKRGGAENGHGRHPG